MTRFLKLLRLLSWKNDAELDEAKAEITDRNKRISKGLDDVMRLAVNGDARWLMPFEELDMTCKVEERQSESENLKLACKVKK